MLLEQCRGPASIPSAGQALALLQPFQLTSAGIMWIAKEVPGHSHGGADVLLAMKATGVSPGIPEYRRAIPATLEMPFGARVNVTRSCTTAPAPNAAAFQTCSASPARWTDLLEISAGKAAEQQYGAVLPPNAACTSHPITQGSQRCVMGQKGKHCQAPADSKHAFPFEAFGWIWLGWWRSLRSTQRNAASACVGRPGCWQALPAPRCGLAMGAGIRSWRSPCARQEAALGSMH